MTEYPCGGGKADRGEQGETDREGSRVAEELVLVQDGDRWKPPNEKFSSNIVAVLLCVKERRQGLLFQKK